MYKFNVPALPISVNKLYKPRVNRYGTSYVQKNSQADDFTQEMYYSCKRPKQPMGKWLSAHIIFTFESNKRFMMADIDNLMKVFFDSLATCQIIENDRFIFEFTVKKVLGKKDSTSGYIEQLDEMI